MIGAAIAIFQSWRRWLHPFIDAGRDLYIPEQLRLGATLYDDILYFYPPVTPYLLAGITSLTGSGLGAYIAIGLVTALLTAAVMWLILRPLAGPWAASCALLIFCSFSLAGVGGWGSNYFFPYAHAATFAMLFFVGAAALLRRGRMIPAMLLLLAASWTKIEYAVFGFALMAFVAVAGGVVQDERTRLRRWMWLPVYATLGAMSVAAAVVMFGADPLRENILPPSLLGGDAAQFFYARVSGVGDWTVNLLLAGRATGLIAGFVLLLQAWDRWPRTRVLLVAGLALLTWLLANESFFRAWTVLQIALLPFALRRPREPLALLLLLSLCASSRIYFNIVPAWYGFVFIIPVVMLMVYVYFEWLPQRGVYSRPASMLWLPLFLVLAASGLVAAHRAYGEAHAVRTSRGTYFDASPERAVAVEGLLRHLQRSGARELVVMPEGLAINYLAQARTPLRYQTFTPAEIVGNEPAIVQELAVKRPERIAIVPRDVSEFGYRAFGDDYGREITDWIRAHYAVEQRFGGIVLLRRVSAGPVRPSP